MSAVATVVTRKLANFRTFTHKVYLTERDTEPRMSDAEFFKKIEKTIEKDIQEFRNTYPEFMSAEFEWSHFFGDDCVVIDKD